MAKSDTDSDTVFLSLALVFGWVKIYIIVTFCSARVEQMMTTSITKPQAEALAALVRLLREDMSFPWDDPGIMTALAAVKDRGDAFAVAHAALYAAEVASNRTPGVIAFAGEHWTRGRQLGADAPIRFERCPEPGHTSFPSHNCGACAAETRGADGPSILEPPSPEQIELTRRGARTVRAALARHTTTEGEP